MDIDEHDLGEDYHESAQTQYPDLDQAPTFAWSGSLQQPAQPVNRYQNQQDGVLVESAPNTSRARHKNAGKPSRAKKSALPVGNVSQTVDQNVPTNLGIGVDSEHEDHADADEAHESDSESVSEVLSDADSDYMELRSDIAKFKATVRKFQDEQRYGGKYERDLAFPQQGRGRTMRLRGGPRGPRKAAEPTGDIRARMGRASTAFIEENYEEAKTLVEEVIRINAETHEAWTLLAAIFRELGDRDKTLLAMIYAAHLRPKDAAQWLSAARYALEETGEQRTRILPSAKFCFSSAIRANPKDDFEARYGKAGVLREMGSTNAAIAEYKHLLRQRPHDTSILRSISEAYIDKDDVQSAQELYRDAVAFYRSTEGGPGELFNWSDVNIYVELFAYATQYTEAIRELRSLSRWLLGRQSETFWDDVMDDCEWDADSTRRIRVSGFQEDRFDLQTYGNGLPLELRVKFGIYRLWVGDAEEAKLHLSWLDPLNRIGDHKVLDYPDLFQDAADALFETGLFDEALEFYRALWAENEHEDEKLPLQMGKCHMRRGEHKEAEESFQAALAIDQDNIDARIQLAKLYEEVDEQEQAFIYINEVMKIKRAERRRKQQMNTDENSQELNSTLMPSNMRPKSYYRSRRLINAEERRKQEVAVAERLQEQYAIMRRERESMRAGDAEASMAWMNAAAELIDDFRGFKTFYPWDKYVRFLGYTATVNREQPHMGGTSLDADLAEMASRISTKLGAEVDERKNVTAEIPENYRGISFGGWLDIFLEYALCLTRYGRHREAYEICEAAKDAIVFYHSKEDMFLIHVCWCACAILASDEETCVSACRYFMKDYQFTTDTYRMFAALTRLCQSPISWYSSGPTQKYILRQIKAMDFGLVDEASRRKYFSEKGSYSAQDETGRLIVNKDMDVALLMVYGHILYTGTSYAYALNYFFRAYALDPDNPMIKLSIGLGYIHYGLKRQAENRQYHIAQGLSFLQDYYQSRRLSHSAEERREASYNLGRTYHMLGLTHLAVPYYMEVLECREGRVNDNLWADTAYNLRTIYAMGGNAQMAMEVTAELGCI